MQGHTLMQAIARANRVTSHVIQGVSKKHGEIVDYYNVFRRMKQALRDYAAGPGDDVALPVKDKQVLFELLDDSIEQSLAFCEQHDVPLRPVLQKGDVFDKLGRFQAFADSLLAHDEVRQAFNVYHNTVSALYEACKPEVLSRGKGRDVAAFQYLRGILDVVTQQVDVDSRRRRLVTDYGSMEPAPEWRRSREYESHWAPAFAGVTISDCQKP